MAYPTKIGGETEPNCIKKGNLWLGVGGRNYGPTNQTGFYATLPPPEDGYVVLMEKSSGGPAVYSCANDSDLIGAINGAEAQSFSTLKQVLNYAAENDIAVVNKIEPEIVTDGLVFNVDASSLLSYPTTESKWYDLSGQTNNGILNNGPTFNSNGAIIFDGVDDKISLNSLITLSGPFTWTATCYSNVMSAAQNRQVYVGGGNTWFEQSDNDTLFIVNNNESSFNLELPTNITPQDKYYNITVKRKSDNTFDYYFNGIKQTLRGGGGYQVSGSYYINTIGSLGIGRYWNGGISKVQVYNKELSQSEILQNYYGGPIVTDGLVLAVDASNLVSYESGSTTAYSMTGSITSTLQNGTAYLSNNGGTWDFDGTNDYLSFDSNSTRTNLGITSYFTFDVWINADSAGDQFGFAGYAPYWGYTMRTNLIDSNTKLIAYLLYQDNNGNWVSSYNGNSVNKGDIGQWVNFVITFDNGLVTHYVNGKAGTSTTLALTGQNPTQNLGYGIIGWNYYEGKFANGKVYNRALTSQEVQQNYLAQWGRFT